MGSAIVPLSIDDKDRHQRAKEFQRGMRPEGNQTSSQTRNIGEEMYGLDQIK